MADLTLHAIKRQLNALNANKYEIGVLDKNEKMLLRTWTFDEITQHYKWLKYQNYNRAHIYVRPAGNQGLIMLDDATRGVIKRLYDDALFPACIIESSPLNFQVWLRFSTESIDNAIATEVAQYLANKYNTDPAAADWRRFGRLAGFTNTKPKHVNESGQYPFALVDEATGKSVNDPGQILKAAAAWNETRKTSRAFTVNNAKPTTNATAFYRQQLAVLTSRYGDSLDVSKADFMIAKSMMQQGFADNDIHCAMSELSPDIHTRKAGRVNQYITNTLNALKESVRRSS